MSGTRRLTGIKRNGQHTEIRISGQKSSEFWSGDKVYSVQKFPIKIMKTLLRNRTENQRKLRRNEETEFGFEIGGREPRSAYQNDAAGA